MRTVRISDSNFSDLAVHLGYINIKFSSVGSLIEHTSELDTHSGTCVVGCHAFIVERHDRVVNVSGYDPTKDTANDIEVVNAAITVDNVDTCESQVAIINKAVHVPTMEHNLLCPMKMRLYGVVVNDTPKFLLRDPTDEDHCVILKNETLDESLRITLSTKGVSSIFTSQQTTKEEYKKSDPFIATSNDPLWDPHDAMFKYQEEAITDVAGKLHKPGDASDNRFLSTVGLGSDTLMPQHSLQLAIIFSDRFEICNASFSKALKSNVQIAMPLHQQLQGTKMDGFTLDILSQTKKDLNQVHTSWQETGDATLKLHSKHWTSLRNVPSALYRN